MLGWSIHGSTISAPALCTTTMVLLFCAATARISWSPSCHAVKLRLPQKVNTKLVIKGKGTAPVTLVPVNGDDLLARIRLHKDDCCGLAPDEPRRALQIKVV